MTDSNAIDASSRLIIKVTFQATKEQIKAIAANLFEETEFGTVVMMETADD